MNGFDVQSEADAMLERQRRDLLPSSFSGKTPGRNGYVHSNVALIQKVEYFRFISLSDIFGSADPIIYVRTY